MAWNEPGGNGKDPWGRKNDDQGPPDLDEVLKKMQDKLGSLFGSGGNKGGKQSSGNGEGINPKIFAVAAVIGFLVWLSFGFYTIQPAYQGVVLRFGEYMHSTEQGLNWHIPYPVEKVERVNVEELRALSHQALMLTQDENIVEIALVVQYQISDAQSYLFNVRDPGNTLRQATESALREVVGKSKMDEVLTSGRDQMAESTKLLTQEILDRYQTGLIVRSVNMQNAQPPEEVQDAFEDVIKAREDEERSKNKAEAYRNEVVQKAGGVSDRFIQEAEAYKAEVEEKSRGETSRFLNVLKEYQKAPEVTRERLYIETMEKVLSKVSKVMIDVEKGNQMMFLPLDKLLGNSRSNISQQNMIDPDLRVSETVPTRTRQSTSGRDVSRERRTR